MNNLKKLLLLKKERKLEIILKGNLELTKKVEANNQES